MFLDTLLICEAAVEMTTAIGCFVLNIYFTWRFANLSTFSRNLRVILVFEHLVTAILTLVHPILVQIPPHVYSLKEGRYLGATLVYSLLFFAQTLLYLLILKFAIVALERSYAFNNCRSYENSNSSIAWRIIKTAVSCGYFQVKKIMAADLRVLKTKNELLQTSIIVCFLLVKLAFCFLLFSTLPIDEILLIALIVDHTIWSFGLGTTICCSSLVYAIFVNIFLTTNLVVNKIYSF